LFVLLIEAKQKFENIDILTMCLYHLQGLSLITHVSTSCKHHKFFHLELLLGHLYSLLQFHLVFLKVKTENQSISM